MKRATQTMGRALLGALVVALIATVAWSQSLTWLGTLGGYYSEAYAVSADGSVVVGVAYNAAREERAFRWTASGGMEDLGTLGGYYSEAYAVSADGSVVVGWAYNGFWERRAFRWTAAGGMQDLGTLGGGYSDAYGVSADGAVVVGVAQNAAGRYPAYRWTALGGMEDLNITYANLLTNAYLVVAGAISPDGRYIVGVANDAARLGEAFLLDTGFPLHGDVDRNGCVDDADLLAVLFAFGGQGYRNEDLNWDGTIDDADLLQVLFHFGSGC
jgi:probable HAF family extracellular repeat protein